jgi:hypothetical protein
MRARGVGHVLLLGLVVGCGAPSGATHDGGPIVGGDAGSPAVDVGAPADAGPIASDGGPLADAGHSPEICTGGIDEDGDTAIDCADSDCWTFADCMAADVVRVAPSLVVCGAAIELDATATAAACAMIGTPMGSPSPTDCASGSLQVTARVYCDSSGAPAALWIEERLTAPETTQMLSARRFRQTYYERASVIDWERQVSGASTREGATGFPIHETQGNGSAGGTLFTVITVRSVLAGDVISRLLGMQFITSIIDLDMPMTMDTRSSLHLGGLAITVPSH